MSDTIPFPMSDQNSDRMSDPTSDPVPDQMLSISDVSLFQDPSLEKIEQSSTEDLYGCCLTLLENLPGPSSGGYPYTRKYSIEEDMSLFVKTKPIYDSIRIYVFELIRRNVLRMEDLEENFDLNSTYQGSPNRSIFLEREAVCSKCFEPFPLEAKIVLVPTTCRMFAHGKIKSFMMCETCSNPYGPYHKNDERIVTSELIKELEWMNYNLMWRDSKEILLPLFRSKYKHLQYVKRTMLKQIQEPNKVE